MPFFYLDLLSSQLSIILLDFFMSSMANKNKLFLFIINSGTKKLKKDLNGFMHDVIH